VFLVCPSAQDLNQLINDEKNSSSFQLNLDNGKHANPYFSGCAYRFEEIQQSTIHWEESWSDFECQKSPTAR
jgi:hypothetical protein